MKRIEFSENKLKLTGFKSFWKINNVLIFATSNLSIEKIHSRSSFELNKLVFRFIFTHFIIRRLKWFLFLHPFYYYLVTLCSVDSIFPEKELNWIIDDRISKIYLSMSFSLKRNSIFFQVYIDIQLEKYSHIQYVFQFSTFFFLFFLW